MVWPFPCTLPQYSPPETLWELLLNFPIKNTAPSHGNSRVMPVPDVCMWKGTVTAHWNVTKTNPALHWGPNNSCSTTTVIFCVNYYMRIKFDIFPPSASFHVVSQLGCRRITGRFLAATCSPPSSAVGDAPRPHLAAPALKSITASLFCIGASQSPAPCPAKENPATLLATEHSFCLQLAGHSSGYTYLVRKYLG